jgi:hypothetical protein
MSIYLGDTPLANNAVSRNIGEIIQSTIPLSDAGLHLLDGSLINDAGSYSAFVTYIAGLVSNYPDLFITETAWQQSITTYGVCGKFVYNSKNNTVRLPKITGFVEGTTDVTALGDLVEAGLPNITGNLINNRIGDVSLSQITPSTAYNTGQNHGALRNTYVTDATQSISTGSNTNYKMVSGIEMDASLSNSIYGNSTTVQPQSIKILYYIVIANSVKTNIEVDIDEIATDLNGKADVDLSNINASGTSLASSWSMPSSRYIDLTLGASGSTYTAPANGWFEFGSGASGVIQLVNTTKDIGMTSLTQSYEARTFVPVEKGDVVTCAYTATPSTYKFIYAEGE